MLWDKCPRALERPKSATFCRSLALFGVGGLFVKNTRSRLLLNGFCVVAYTRWNLHTLNNQLILNCLRLNVGSVGIFKLLFFL